jgi:ABC-type phosphate/phosphonate transport system, ATPase component
LAEEIAVSVIHARSVTKRFPNGFEALKGIDLEIQPGSFTVVLGPSGAGKSTLLRLLNGLETPTSGEVRVYGQPVDRRHLRRIRSQVAMVFHQFNLVSRLSCVTNV